MRDVLIKYNPYRLETDVLIDGQAPKQNSRLNFSDRRLQEWIDELPEILFEECSSRDFQLTFHGTMLDYEDVEAMVQDAKNKNIHIKLTHIPAKEVADKEAAINEIFQEIQNGPFEELKQPDVIKAFNMAKSSDFEVNVVATMSAGKSTLINALLRKKLMPAKQEACTATITEIKDTDSDCFTAKAYDINGNLLQTYSDLTYEIMDSLNSNDKVSRIRIEGNIPFVESDDVSLVLVDTPGPNNSRDPEHKAATYRMLSESSKAVVLYILNATQLAVNDDYNLLRHVSDSMKVGGKQSRDRFIFVINKLDDFRKGEDSVEAAISKVRDYLADNGIENANIYPASALTALDIRTILAESDDDDIDEVYDAKGKVRKFNRNPEMHFENLAPLTPFVRGKIENSLAEARNNKDVNGEALIHCGIVPIEMAIQMYVQKYAKTAKIKNIVDTFSKRLESAKSFEKTKQEISSNQEQQETILKNIELIQRKLANGEDAKAFKVRIDKINYGKEIEKSTKNSMNKAQEKMTEFSRKLIRNKETNSLTVVEAEIMAKDILHYMDDVQASFQVELEDLISNHILKNVEELLAEYKRKLSDLTQELDVTGIRIDSLELIEGDLSTDVNLLINTLTKIEHVKVGEEWEKNLNKKWYKPWTWFQEKGHWKEIYEDQERINAEDLFNEFFVPMNAQLYENKSNAVKYAEKQTKIIKDAFSDKFDELDKVLALKLKELEAFASDNEKLERRIKESRDKLEWLENVQEKVKTILDI